MKEFMKSKKGKMVIVAVAVLLLLIGILYSCSSGKEDKNPSDTNVEQNADESNEAQQDVPENTGDGLEVGDSLGESEDTLSVSGGESNANNATSTDKDSTDSNSEDSNSETQTPAGNKTEDNKTPETFGELY